MSLEYSCFISYPHGQQNVLVPFVRDLVAGLQVELGAQLRKPIFSDSEGMEGGSRIRETLGPSICKSACMVMLYTPLYFDKDNTYCAQELQAMLELEAQRMEFLVDKGKGLIIPIILRGEKWFPKELRTDRLYYRFDDIELNDPNEKIRIRYAKQIREIAEYILERWISLDDVSDRLHHDCGGYCLPTPERAVAFVEALIGRKRPDVAVPFVIRREVPPQA